MLPVGSIFFPLKVGQANIKVKYMLPVGSLFFPLKVAPLTTLKGIKLRSHQN